MEGDPSGCMTGAAGSTTGVGAAGVSTGGNTGSAAGIEVVGIGGRSSGGTERGTEAEGATGSTGMDGVGNGGRSSGGIAAGATGDGATGDGVADMVGSGVEAAGDAVPPSLAIVSSASFMRRSVAFWKISSSLVMVEKTLGRSGSLVLLTMSMRLILIGSRSGESISKFISDCLFSVSGITSTLYDFTERCQLVIFSTHKV